jgi:thiol-disulfide isomerase/thioredoxin
MKNLWTTRRIIFTLIVLLLVALFFGSSCNSNDRTTTTTATNSAYPTLPPVVLETELRAASGSPIKLSDYSGKVLLVNLWATWCGPCRLETPELVKLHKEYQARGVEMVGLSTENPDASAQRVG